MARIALLIPAQTYRASDFTRAAGRLGVEVVVVTDEAQVLGHLMGGRAVSVDLGDAHATADAICRVDSEMALDAVVAVDATGVVGAALAAERLGLPSNPPGSVAATRDKVAQRQAFSAAEVPQPDFRVAVDAESAVDAAVDIGLPVVVKPTDLSASRGVIRADDAAAVRAAVQTIRDACVPDGPLLVERFLAGDEVAVEALLDAGRLSTLAVFDKPGAPQGPAFPETMLVTPSRHSPDTILAIEHAVASAAAALGLQRGPVHAEARVGPGGEIGVLEVAARTIGGLCSRAIHLATGRSLEEVVLANAAGFDPGALASAEGAAGVFMLPVPRSGTFVRVDGTAAAAAVAGITSVDVTVTAGTRVEPLPHDGRYLGFVFAAAATPSAVEASLRAAVDRLTIVVD